MTSQTTTDVVRWQEDQAIALGNPNQQDRWRAGVLPEDELAALARDELFAPLGVTKRWNWRQNVRAIAYLMKHAEDCQIPITRPGETAYAFETTEVTELESAEWDALQAIEAHVRTIRAHRWLANVGPRDHAVVLQTASHWATCRTCEHEAVRSVAKVSIQWAGRTLTREYLL